MREIERKFIVDKTKVSKVLTSIIGKSLHQGYFKNIDESTTRIRISDDKAFLTIKSNEIFDRYEFEIEIDINEAQEMLRLFCANRTIKKTRYKIHIKDKIWEIDIFSHEYEGLVVAEIELDSADEEIELPDFIIEEVTHNLSYSNYSLALNRESLCLVGK